MTISKKHPSLLVYVSESRPKATTEKAHALIATVRSMVAEHGLVDVLRAVAAVSDEKPKAPKQVHTRKVTGVTRPDGVSFELGDKVMFLKRVAGHEIKVTGTVESCLEGDVMGVRTATGMAYRVDSGDLTKVEKKPSRKARTPKPEWGPVDVKQADARVEARREKPGDYFRIGDDVRFETDGTVTRGVIQGILDDGTDDVVVSCGMRGRTERVPVTSLSHVKEKQP